MAYLFLHVINVLQAFVNQPATGWNLCGQSCESSRLFLHQKLQHNKDITRLQPSYVMEKHESGYYESISMT